MVLRLQVRLALSFFLFLSIVAFLEVDNFFLGSYRGRSERYKVILLLIARTLSRQRDASFCLRRVSRAPLLESTKAP